MKKTKEDTLFCKFLYKVGRILFPKRAVEYEEIPEDETAIYVCNHSGALGPAAMTAWFDRPFRPWSISCLFDKRVAANFIFHDFFFGRSKKHKKFYRFLSKIVAKFLPPLVYRQNPILVHRNSVKILQTFKESVATLKQGKNLVIFPESPIKFSRYISELYDGFIDVARLYYAETGKRLKFYPVYIPADKRIIKIGKPIEYNIDTKPAEERKAVANYLKENIDRIARELKPKKVIPFLKEEFYTFYPEFIHDTAAYWAFCNNERSE
ncbi:MAG TPA: 1-acyl-sn-glycerol-3-phosphate acyltransferase [Clostridia bacterium]|nr:1-acyl-sn-glycerol-3-phosphate acyltransferase [Clostridia bacterium]